MPNTEPYPTRWTTVHFGIRADDIDEDTFQSIRTTVLSQGWPIYIDGDGWQYWGVGTNTGGNTDDTMHIQVAVPTKADAATVISLLRNSALPFVVNTENLTVLVTPSEDFADVGYSELFA